MNEENLTAIEPGREVIVMQLGGGSQFLEKAESSINLQLSFKSYNVTPNTTS